MIRFLVFGDLHYDTISDGEQRIKELIDKAQKEKVDFIVSLGDLCFPIEENRHVLEKFKTAGIPIYHTIGNHDTQVCSIEEMLLFLSNDNSYYSFEYGEYKCIILDSCFWQNQSGQHHFTNKRREPAIYPVIPCDEVLWLKKELSDNKKYIIFSHQSLVNEFGNRGIRNRQEILDLYVGKNIILCMNGHDHGDDLKIINNIPFYTVNASSGYCWWGGNPSGSEVKDLPYKNALHVVIELDETEIRIKGIESEYQDETPDDVGVRNYRWNGVSIQPKTSSYRLTLHNKN